MDKRHLSKSSEIPHGKKTMVFFHSVKWEFWAISSSLWQYGLWSFQTAVTKLERVLPKNQQTQRKSLNFENWISMGLRSFQKSEFQKSNISILPCTKLMNNEILVVFQCEKWFTYQTTWFKTHLLRFFNWKLSQIFDFINKKQ